MPRLSYPVFWCPILCYFKGLWSVINNAGVGRIGPLDWQSLDDMKKMADVNLWGLIDVTKTFLPLLKISGGRLVNIGSIGGKIELQCSFYRDAGILQKFILLFCFRKSTSDLSRSLYGGI